MVPDSGISGQRAEQSDESNDKPESVVDQNMLRHLHKRLISVCKKLVAAKPTKVDTMPQLYTTVSRLPHWPITSLVSIRPL